MIFFQQSAVVDKSLQEKDITAGKVDTAIGSLFTVVVAAFCVILTGTLLPGQNINDAASAAASIGRAERGSQAEHSEGKTR